MAVRLDGASHGLHVDKAVFGDVDGADDSHGVTRPGDHVAPGDDAGWVGAVREVGPSEAGLVLGAQIDAQVDPFAQGRTLPTADRSRASVVGWLAERSGGTMTEPRAQGLRK